MSGYFSGAKPISILASTPAVATPTEPSALMLKPTLMCSTFQPSIAGLEIGKNVLDLCQALVNIGAESAGINFDGLGYRASKETAQRVRFAA